MSEKINQNALPVKGRISAKNCECCGHHEIGITLKDGAFLALKPGMIVEIVEVGDGNPELPGN
jgi:hypothetical protein